MRDLTELFCKELPQQVNTMAAMLLRIDANVPANGGVMLAGGWVRDLYFGVTPKDMDFAFHGLGTDALLDVLRMFRARSPYDVTSETFDQYEGGDERLITVLKVIEHQPDGPVEMDWILYNCNTQDAILDSFDHSINAFYARYTGDFRLEIGHHGEWGVCTRNTETDCKPERVERMKEMARIADWEYVG